MPTVTNVTTEAGFIVVTFENSSIPQRFAIADVLRAADIPALTKDEVSTIKTLANLIVILIRTLISRKVLNEDFIHGEMEWDLDHLIYAIERMGGSYEEPDLGDALNTTATE